ncbi:LPS assembly lipoprotein LptE [Pseudooceanicola aestuarii]|uniref:LPS assembly lipoprotein LptE n=1 Tax=Pseudooceanicola aestuarii TaxID=2697319 RepID=UPI0013D291A1|nr:LPS assembly lipoprotein LptE [Pseudooceanicola aestuarii]
MWSPDRRSLLMMLAAAPLGACGFTPAYAPGGGGDLLLNRTRIADPNTRESYVLVQELEQRLGRATAPDYDLTLKLSLYEAPLAITSDSVTARFNVLGRVDYTLTEIATGRKLGQGWEENFASYSTTGSTVATRAARADARERVVRILVDQLIARLIADAHADAQGAA